MTDDSATVNLSVTLGYPGDGALNLGFPSEYEDELLTLLDAAGVQHEPVLAHSEVADVLIEAIKILGTGGGVAGTTAAIASIVKTIVQRNVGKRVVIDGVEVDGFSEKAIERILQKRAAELEERDAKASEQDD